MLKTFYLITAALCYTPISLFYRNKLACCDPLDLKKEKEIYRNMSCSYEFPIN